MVQVKSGDLMEISFSSFISNEKQLSTATGLPTFQLLENFEKIVNRVSPHLSSYRAKLIVHDRIILTFMRKVSYP